jgi:hypothetical protein
LRAQRSNLPRLRVRFFIFLLAAGLSIIVVTPNSCSGNVVQGAFSGSPCPLGVTLVWGNKLPFHSLPAPAFNVGTIRQHSISAPPIYDNPRFIVNPLICESVAIIHFRFESGIKVRANYKVATWQVYCIGIPVPIGIGISSGFKIESNHSFGWIFVFPDKNQDKTDRQATFYTPCQYFGQTSHTKKRKRKHPEGIKHK